MAPNRDASRKLHPWGAVSVKPSPELMWHLLKIWSFKNAEFAVSLRAELILLRKGALGPLFKTQSQPHICKIVFLLFFNGIKGWRGTLRNISKTTSWDSMFVRYMNVI